VYWLKNPLWVLILAMAGTVLCGVFLNPWIFALTALLLVVVGAGTVLPWVAIKGINCQVMFDVRRVAFGQPALVRLRIHNRWPLPVWGLSLINGFASGHIAHDRQLSDGDEGIAFARVPGWSTMEYSWAFVAKRRGLYPVNGLAEVETSFPFGLFRARRPADVQGQLIVWPETTSLLGLPDAAESQVSDDTFSDRRVGDFGDVLGTRPFRAGDSLRRVHWAQTARQQTLIVTERQAPLTTSVRIVLDVAAASTRTPTPPPSSPRWLSGVCTTSPTSGNAAGTEPGRGVVQNPLNHRINSVAGGREEQCIRVAASLCDSLHRQHCRVELQVGDRLFVVSNSEAGLQRAMDALAVFDASDDQRSGAAKAARVGRSSEFTITVTTADNAVPGRRRQIVVVDAAEAGSGTRQEFRQGDASKVLTTSATADCPSAIAVSAWILLNAGQPLSELAAAWRKVCHD